MSGGREPTAVVVPVPEAEHALRQPAVLDGAGAAVRRHLVRQAVAVEPWLVELVAEGWWVRERLPFGR